MDWSKAQKQAIFATGGTLLLSAAAGSGKTAVVVERIINKIINKKNKINIDELLIVTFSNAAATELKERISKKIDELLLNQPDDIYFQKQQILLETANISTIHSFCQNLIRENFSVLSVSADFKICNEYQASLLKYQAFCDIIDEFYKIPEFNNLLKITDTTYDSEKLFKIINNIFDFLMAIPFCFDWLDQNLLDYKNINISESKFIKIIFKNSLELAEQAKNIIITCLDISIEFENYLDYQNNFNQKLDFLNNLLYNIKNNLWQETFDILNNFNITSLPRTKKNTDPELKQNLKDLHDEFKIIINNLKSNYFFVNQEEFIQDINYISQNFELLTQIIKKFFDKYTELKFSKNYLDFSDLEQLAIKLLLKKDGDKYIKTQIAQNISENFKEIFIDEYQDTNLTQEYIFKAISKQETNLFLVGDAKQSIYRFRQARPELFVEKNNNYNNFDGQNFPAKIILNQNFRSNENITCFVNFIFFQLMSIETGEIDYDNNQKLVSFFKDANLDSKNQDTQTEICLLKTDQKQSSEKKLFSEAYCIATKIKQMVENKFKIKKNNILSEVTYGDFCILMRSPNEKTKYFIKAFNQLGVPLVAEQNNNLFESTEITTIISFLKIINNPLDDISLSSVMLSEIFEFSSDDILILKNYNQPSLFQAIKEDIKTPNSKYIKLYKYIILFKNFSNFLSLDKLLEKIYIETDFYNIIKINKNKNTRQNNLDLFKNLAKEFSESVNNNLVEFIYYLNKLNDQKLSLQTNNTENISEIDCVKLMSIHKSKGLEFNIVILADTSRQINKIDIRSSILFHPDLGFGFNKFDINKNIKYSTLPKSAIKLELEKNMLSEELRILYVALTRAREKLIIIIFDNNYQKRFDYWASLLAVNLRENKLNKTIPTYLIKQAKNYEDFFILALLRHPESKKIINNNNIISLTDKLPQIIINQVSYNQENISDNQDIINNIIKIKPNQNQDIINIIKKQIDYNYYFKNLSSVPSKLGVSDIAKKDLILKFSFEKKPKLFYKNNLTNAELGNILHKFMQFADYKQAKLDLNSECLRLLNQEFISQEEYENLDQNKLAKFFNSKLYNIISSADKVYRELRFVYPISTSQLSYSSPQETNHDNIIVQGIADCVIENKDEIIIIDYKTDKINYIDELYQKYSDQILIYQEALSKIFHKKSNKSIIYSFYLNKYYIIKN